MPPKNIRKTALTEEQIEILQDRLEEFNNAQEGRTKKETAAKRQEIREDATKALWKINPGESNRSKDELEKCIGSWFNNHKTVQSSKKGTARRVWKAREVFAKDQDWKERIHEEAERISKHPSGTREFLGAFQPALKALWDGLSSDEQDAYEETARKWNAATLPRDVQLQQLKKQGDKPIREFALNVFKELGMRVFILSATRETNNRVAVSWHDYNDELGHEGFPTVDTEWDSGPVFDAWTSYAQGAFDTELDEVPAKEKKTTSDIQLDLDENDLPILPDPLPTSRPDLDSTVRQFVTGYYRVACGKPKVKVPWKAIAKRQDDFIDSDVMPEGFNLMEPSKLHAKDLATLLKHWGKVGFQFRCYEVDGKLETAEDQIPERAKGKGKAKSVGQQVKSGTSVGKKPAPKESTAKPANRGGRRNLPSSGSESPDEDELSRNSSPEPPAREGPGPSKPATTQPKKTDPTPKNTKSTVDPEKSQITYLESLCTRKEYRALIRVVYAAPISGSSAYTQSFPKFADWNWNDPHLPRDLHMHTRKMKVVLDWLERKPYFDKAGHYLGRLIGERITLAIGLLLSDITAVQFADEDGNEASILDIFPGSVLEFALIDDMLLPFCTQMAADITVPSTPPSPAPLNAPDTVVKASTAPHRPTAKPRKAIPDAVPKVPESLGEISAPQKRSSGKPKGNMAAVELHEDAEDSHSNDALKVMRVNKTKMDGNGLRIDDGAGERRPSRNGGAEALSTHTGKKRKRISESGEFHDIGEHDRERRGEEAEVEVVPDKTAGRSQPTRGAKTNHTQIAAERREPKKKVEKVPASKQPTKKRNRR